MKQLFIPSVLAAFMTASLPAFSDVGTTSVLLDPVKVSNLLLNSQVADCVRDFQSSVYDIQIANIRAEEVISLHVPPTTRYIFEGIALEGGDIVAGAASLTIEETLYQQFFGPVFGFPAAHEDDAQRAVYTGLGIPQAMAALNTRLEADYGVQLAVRIGIHTGPVVVGEMGGGGRHENLALGETPNIAARLEGLAQPNTAVISPVTAQLVQRSFVLEELGAHELKGLSAPMTLYRARTERAADSRFEAMHPAGLTPFVGRDEEIGLLLGRWGAAKGSEGQVVLLEGEPGIGKSRITNTFRELIDDDTHTRLQYQCSPFYNNSAFYPIITQLERAARFETDDSPDTRLDKLETLIGADDREALALIGGLLSLSIERYASLSMSPQKQKERTIAAR